MQTNPTPAIREKASDLYEHLAEKHQTFIYSKNSECVKKAFEYQLALFQPSEIVDGKSLTGLKWTIN